MGGEVFFANVIMLMYIIQQEPIELEGQLYVYTLTTRVTRESLRRADMCTLLAE